MELVDFIVLKFKFVVFGVEIIGVLKDSLKSYVNFVMKKDLMVILVSDEYVDVCEQFGVWVEKNMYGKKYMGIECLIFFIFVDGIIVEVWRKVKVKGYV